ncbi:MAG: flagellar basal body-associated protein FliL [Thiobacillus sp.]
MSAKPAKPADAAAEPEAAPRSKKMLFIIIGAVVFALAAGGGAAWFFTKGSGEHEEVKEAPPKDPIFMPLETFTVNLGDGETILQTEITLQVSDPKEVEAIKLQMPRIRSRLLSLLSSKLPDNLGSIEDKKALSDEIKAEVNKPFHEKGDPQHVEDVLFTSFIIQ